MSVYLIEEEGQVGWKIGYTESLNPESRRKQLQTGACGIHSVLYFIPGASMEVEKSLHLKFEHLNLHDEWFIKNPDIIAAFEALGATPNPEFNRASVTKELIEKRRKSDCISKAQSVGAIMEYQKDSAKAIEEKLSSRVKGRQGYVSVALPEIR